MKRNQRGLWLAILLLFTAAAVQAGELEETFDKTYPFRPGQRFELKNSNGSVRIYTWDREEVRIEAVKRVKCGSRSQAEKLMREIRIEVEETGDGLRVNTYLPRTASRGFLSWLFDGFSSYSVSVKYSVWLPAHADAEIRTVNGSIYAKEVDGKVSLRSTNGKIQVENARGDLQASTTNGSISVELLEVDPDANLRLRTTNGSVKLYLPRDFEGEISARTTNGSIATDFPIEVSGKISRHLLHGRIGNGTAVCDIATTNGSVKIRAID